MVGLEVAFEERVMSEVGGSFVALEAEEMVVLEIEVCLVMEDGSSTPLCCSCG